MWAPRAAPELDSGLGDHSVDQQEHCRNAGSYAGGSAVSVPQALASLRCVLGGEGAWRRVKDGVVCSLVFLQHFPLNGTFAWRSRSALLIRASFAVLLTFHGLCWHRSLEGWSRSNRLQPLPWKAGKVTLQGSGICQRYSGNSEGQLSSLFIITFNP